MAIAVGGHDHKQGTTSTLTLSTAGVTTQATGSTFLIGVIAAGASNISAVQDNKTNSYTQIGTSFNTAFGSSMAWYRKENGLGGAGHTITSTLLSGQVQTIYFVEITGAATSSVLDQSVAFVGDASSPFTTNTTGTTAQADEIAIALYGTDTPSGTETITWGNGFTQIDADGNSNFVTGGIGFKVLSATGTVQGSITSSVATDTAGAVATFKAAAGGNVTVALTGAATTWSAGTVTQSRTVALTGALATWAAGTLSPGTALPLTNALTTFSAGTLLPSTAVALTNALMTWSPGTVTVSGSGDVTVALTGASSTWSAGNLTANTDKALTGALETWSAGTLTATPTVGLTGAAFTFSTGSVTPSTSVLLSNAITTWAAGTLGVQGDVTVALTGASTTWSAGTLTASGGDSGSGGVDVSGGGHRKLDFEKLKKKKKQVKKRSWRAYEIIEKLAEVSVIKEESNLVDSAALYAISELEISLKEAQIDATEIYGELLGLEIARLEFERDEDEDDDLLL